MTLFACKGMRDSRNQGSESTASTFVLQQQGDQIQLMREGEKQPILTQHAAPDHRPYLHPILAPQSDVELTQYSPGHHKHQTGLYWGFTRVNGTTAPKDTLKKWFYRADKPERVQEQIGRDFFHHPAEGYWEKVSAEVLIEKGETVKWQTIYHMLDAAGEPIMEETQIWSFHEHAQQEKYLIALEWKGKALIDITINEFDYGGLFLRMPWKEGMEGEAVNAARQRNERAEGQRAMWMDVGLNLEGLTEWGHIAIFDHPDNAGFPQTWRVDGQLGVGPVRAKRGDWHIHKGETETIRHQIVAYTGELSDVEMNDLWAEYVGDDGMYNKASLWGIAQEEGRLAEFLTPEEAAAHMTVKEGYQVNVYASEPMITQPMAFCWDDRGRMWIAENRDYESRGSGFANDGTSRILILEDTDRDGQADKQTVFLEGIPFPAGIAVGFDGLYLGAPPNLLFVPDKDQNDKADVEDIQVLLTGWGIRDRHETINSLHWGPDGWLYGLEGFATPSKIRKPKGKGRLYKAGEAFPEDILEGEGVDINGGVWRYHPIKDRFEVVAHGFSNPWGIDYDAKGQFLISACVIPHLFHVIPGGIYHRQGGSHFNPYVYEDIQTIVDHRHRSAHGGARIYQSDAFPEEQYGRIFMANIHEHAVLSDILKPNGSGFTASHGEDFLLANNAAWIGFSLEVGPEGAMYVLDWHDGDICGKEVLNKETGRVFRITPKESLAEEWEGRYANIKSLSDLELVELQLKRSNWHSRRARLVLQHRAFDRELAPAAINRLNEIIAEQENGDLKLRAIWAKHICRLSTEEELLSYLASDDPYIRGWGIQFIMEDGQPSEQALAAMLKVAEEESSPVVRLYLAAALQRMELDDRWEIAETLVQYAEDKDDPNIPYMLWFGVEPLVAVDAERALEIAKKSEIPSLARKIARRLVDANRLEPVVQALEENGTQRESLLTGLVAGLAGRTDVEKPANWEKVYATLESEEEVADLALEVAQLFGSAAAAQQMVKMIINDQESLANRSNAIIGLAGTQREELIPYIPQLLEDPALRIEAIRSVAAYQEETLGEVLLARYPLYTLTEQQEILQTMASRPSYGWQLAYAIKEGQIAKSDIPAYVALQLKRVVGNGFVEIWGPIDEVSQDKQADFAKYQRLLQDDVIAAADPGLGRSVFQRNCGSCHQMYGVGGKIGPDLTGSNRANVPYLLSNILDPSGVIQDDYKMVVLTTQDGRTYSGNIVAENDRQLTMNVVGQEAFVLDKSAIRTREDTPYSLMPEGLLNHLTDEEVIQLAAYMRTTEQVPLPTEL